MRRIAGLDSIRFLCALTVLFHHKANPLASCHLLTATHAGRLIIELYTDLLNGQAAVLVFFLISGFCIHYPYASGRPFATVPFLLARGVRIMIPVGAYLLLLRVAPYTKPLLTVLLWSIWCELIYYALYPVLRGAFARTSALAVLIFSYLPACAVSLYALKASDGYFNAGGLTWLAGLPCWILGCQLAERFKASKGRSGTWASVWSYRAGVVGMGIAIHYAMRNLNVPFLISFQFFAVLAYFWIQSELHWHWERPAIPLLERLGSLTFSLYLVHALANCVWESLVPGQGLVLWAAEAGFAVLLGAIFYALVERPSHMLARRLSFRPGGDGKAAVPNGATND